MKQVLLAAGAMLFLLASCKDADHSEKTTDTQTAKNSSNNRMVYKAIETGDVSGLDSVMTPDIIDHEGGMDGKDIVGRDSVKARLADMHNHFTDLRMDVVSESTADNGYNFVLVKMTGTAKDASMHMTPGTKLNSTSVDVVKLKDGKAVEHWYFVDPKEMMDMMKAGMPPANKMDSAGKKM